MLNAFIEDFDSIKLVILSVTLIVFSGIIDDVWVWITLSNLLSRIYSQ